MRKTVIKPFKLITQKIFTIISKINVFCFPRELYFLLFIRLYVTIFVTLQNNVTKISSKNVTDVAKLYLGKSTMNKICSHKITVF